MSGALSILLLFIIRATASLLFVQAVEENDNATTTANLLCNPLGYIVVLRDNVSATPKAISQEYESKGVNVTHVYESGTQGI